MHRLDCLRSRLCQRRATFSFRLILASALLSASVPSVSANDVFPIGIYYGDVMPRSMRFTGNEHNLCADNDSSCSALQWTNLEEIRGDTETDTTFGYHSSFNVVVGGKATAHAAVQTYDIDCLLEHARDLDFKVLLTLPNNYTTPDEGPAYWDSLNFYQRSPQILDPAYDTITHYKYSEYWNSIYGWYIADEPANLLTHNGFHGGSISASKLKTAYEYLRASADSTHPYVFAMPDYDVAAFNKFPWTVYSEAQKDSALGDWRWNNPGGDTLCFEDHWSEYPTQLRICLTQDYTESADIIQEDTYEYDLERWTKRLGAINDLVGSKPNGTHMILSCWPDTLDARPGLGVLEYQAFAGIVHGVTGIWVFSYNDCFDDPDSCVIDSSATARGRIRMGPASNYFRSTLATFSNDLSDLNDFLVSPTVVKSWPEADPDSAQPIHYAMKEANGEGLLIAVNTTNTVITHTFSLSSHSSAIGSNGTCQ